MKTFAIALAVLATASSASGVFAQSAPVRGVGLLALNASDARSSAGARTTLIEVPDGGGGGLVGARAMRGSGDGDSARDAAAPAAPDALPAKPAIAPGDPTAPATMAPKRTNYRWQALVPGAIK